MHRKANKLREAIFKVLPSDQEQKDPQFTTINCKTKLKLFIPMMRKRKIQKLFARKILQ